MPDAYYLHFMELDRLLTGIVWHATGIACVIGVVVLIRRILRESKGQGIGRSVAAGVAGLIACALGMFAWVLLEIHTSFFDFLMQVTLLIRFLFYVPLFYLIAWGSGRLAGRLLRSRLPAKVVLYASLLLGVLLILQPIAGGWWYSLSHFHGGPNGI